MLEPGQQVIPTAGDEERQAKVGVSSNLPGTTKGTLHLEVPAGWRVEPAKLAIEFHKRGEKQEVEFKIFPATLKEGRAKIRAVLESGGVDYSEGYNLVTREDLGSFYYYQPAVQRISIVDVNVPKDLHVGYISGAGDTMIGVGAAYQRKPNIELRSFAICDKPTHAEMAQVFVNWRRLTLRNGRTPN